MSIYHLSIEGPVYALEKFCNKNIRITVENLEYIHSVETIGAPLRSTFLATVLIPQLLQVLLLTTYICDIL